jgi:hypothetical protein
MYQEIEKRLQRNMLKVTLISEEAFVKSVFRDPDISTDLRVLY